MLKMTDVGLDFADADLNLSFGPEGTNIATVSGREYQLLVSLVESLLQQGQAPDACHTLENF